MVARGVPGLVDNDEGKRSGRNGEREERGRERTIARGTGRV